jgi:hypothetical protein
MTPSFSDGSRQSRITATVLGLAGSLLDATCAGLAAVADDGRRRALLCEAVDRACRGLGGHEDGLSVV